MTYAKPEVVQTLSALPAICSQPVKPNGVAQDANGQYEGTPMAYEADE
jgi:hypothetical protein